jgi:D-beta-D-heptose 7-phosphate kinase/D-beta-D-heptose 1-phosphate adenosyltransferase
MSTSRSSTNAVHIVQQFRRVRALVLGDAMLDTYLLGSASRLCSEGPVPVVAKTEEYRVPGGAANTAANIQALGAHTMFLGIVGADMNGTALKEALRRYRVSDRWLIEDPKGTTLHKMRIVADRQYVVRLDEGKVFANPRQHKSRVLAALEEAYGQCDVVVVSDYGYGLVSGEVIARLKQLRERRYCPLIVDSKQLAHFRGAQATVITPNALEARLLVQSDDTPAIGLANAPALDADRLSRRLLDMFDTEHVAITLASDGVLLTSRDRAAIHLPAHQVPQANDVGAGDSFTAALALALAAGASPPDATQIGLDCASIAVTKRFTSVVTQRELLQHVSLREHVCMPPSMMESRHTLNRVRAHLEIARQAGRRIVFTNGVFDLLHAGHVEFLRQAKALGDVLVVGVNSDRSARQIKGSHRPVTGERERLALVAALDPVDHVVLFDDEHPAALIRAIRPDFHVKGGDYARQNLPEAAAVREVGGRVVILPLVGDLSSSRMIERIVTGRSARSAAGGR